MDYFFLISLIILIMFSATITVFLAYLVFGDHSFNITYQQKFSEEERQLLEDLYNEKGDIKNREFDMLETLDGAIREINSIMTGAEEDEING